MSNLSRTNLCNVKPSEISFYIISSIKKLVVLYFRPEKCAYFSLKIDILTLNYRKKWVSIMEHQNCGSHGCSCYELDVSSLSLSSDNTAWFSFCKEKVCVGETTNRQANGANRFIICSIPLGSKEGTQDPLSFETWQKPNRSVVRSVLWVSISRNAVWTPHAPTLHHCPTKYDTEYPWRRLIAFSQRMRHVFWVLT